MRRPHGAAPGIEQKRRIRINCGFAFFLYRIVPGPAGRFVNRPYFFTGPGLMPKLLRKAR